MNIELINFYGAQNVEFEEFMFCEGQSEEVPSFTLTEPTADEWNTKARRQNTKMFVEVLKRQPKNYEEVLIWANSFIPGKKESHATANNVTFV